MYLEFPFEYAEIEGLGRLFYPIARLAVKTIAGWYDFDFLVDTGADVTTVPSHFLPVLGLKKSNLSTSYTTGVGGFSVKTWDFLLTLKVGETKLRVVASAVETKEDSEPLLLGRKDIFETRFNLFLDSKRKLTVISENK
ncbi:retroviral-like aspartic protease family protein [Candidatus Roizmanbacteria bacterium]|nr:retroviral-like aspartic protease family protein [Candidatus Roizmanbacteria bacterium]